MNYKKIPKNSQKIPLRFPKKSQKFQKRFKDYQKIQEFPTNYQDFENIQFLISHLEAENPFGLVLTNFMIYFSSGKLRLKKTAFDQ